MKTTTERVTFEIDITPEDWTLWTEQERGAAIAALLTESTRGYQVEVVCTGRALKVRDLLPADDLPTSETLKKHRKRLREAGEKAAKDGTRAAPSFSAPGTPRTVRIEGTTWTVPSVAEMQANISEAVRKHNERWASATGRMIKINVAERETHARLMYRPDTRCGVCGCLGIKRSGDWRLRLSGHVPLCPPCASMEQRILAAEPWLECYGGGQFVVLPQADQSAECGYCGSHDIPIKDGKLAEHFVRDA